MGLVLAGQIFLWELGTETLYEVQENGLGCG